MNDKVIVIDLGKYVGPIFTGRSRGEAVRKDFDLNKLDNIPNVSFIVKIPPDTFALNSSFFLGLFGPSVRTLGSRDRFLTRFKFQNPDHISEFIESGVERALQERQSLIP